MARRRAGRGSTVRAVDWFATQLLDWFDTHGRHDLPWQTPDDPYRVWVSEIMLQQTQVATVIPYFQRFIAAFPTVESLAEAPADAVMHQWSGLGYYSRARNLHAAAKRVVSDFAGTMPNTAERLTKLPGIGRSTAAAIAAICYGEHAAILDGNVRRVLGRFHAIEGTPGTSTAERDYWRHAETHTPEERTGDYTQAIMDLGATLCTRSRPRCCDCPMAERCTAFAEDRIAEFPARRARKDKPVRETHLCVFLAPDGACLLERRPSSGIWGGLWCFPEASNPDAIERVAHTFGIDWDRDVQHTRNGEPFRHTFSHYHLDITPVYIVTQRQPLPIADNDRLLWYRSGRDNVGLAAPTTRLLKGIEELTSP